ncbi:MAG: right-handed parallel beta-helix repeat-containing protein [Spirochaetes bacterium]|nr:right-handed parallel beta-helix repeat-containing protein [Spirochaetota bacterium]
MTRRLIRTACLLACFAPFSSPQELLASFDFDEGKGGASANRAAGGTPAQVGAEWVQGAFGGALYLNGESARIARVNVPEGKAFGKGSFSLSLWFCPETFAIEAKEKRRRLLNIVDAWPEQYFNLETKENGGVSFGGGYKKDDGKYGGVGISSKALLATNAWTHLACVLDRENRKTRLYLNGKLDMEYDIVADFDADFKNDKPITIGSSWQGCVGAVDGFRLWKGAVSAAAVLAEYDAKKNQYTKAPAKPVDPNAPLALPPERTGPPLTFHVAPDGNDAWSGTKEKAAGGDGPLRTLAKASLLLKAGDTLLLHTGVWRETLDLRRSGTPSAPIVVKAAPGEKPVLSGAEPLTGWKQEDRKVWSAPMDFDLEDQNQLFASGDLMLEARWPNSPVGMEKKGQTPNATLECVRATMAAGRPDAIVDPEIPGDDGFWKGATVWCGGGAVWYFWNVTVKDYDSATHTLSFDPRKGDNDWYLPRKGNEYVLMGVRGALDAEGEWFLDRGARRMLFIPPNGANPEGLCVEAKRRIHVIRALGVSNLRIEGLAFRGGGILLDEKTRDITLKDLRGEYLGHSFVSDVSGTGTVALLGSGLRLESCELGYASGSLVTVRGSNNTVVNCFLHDADYAGKWGASVTLAGRRLVFAHNTVKDSGRDILGTGLTESIVEHNDLSGAGHLTHDLGMTYGHTVDYQNTVFRYNRVHDNLAKKTGMGIYFDHVAMNVIVHNNAIWNVMMDPVRVNNPGYYNLVFHNTAWNCGGTGTFDHSKRNDLFGCRYYNNIVNKPVTLPKHVSTMSNLSTAAIPGLKLADPEKERFELAAGSSGLGAAFPIAGFGKDVGAYPSDKAPWKAGHDFSKPAPQVSWAPTDVPYMNLVKNSCFEFGVEYWSPTGGNARQVPGNGWGNGGGRTAPEPMGSARGELELTGDGAGVEQVVLGLSPKTAYTLSCWVKTAEGERIEAGVADFGGPAVKQELEAVAWTRLYLEFKTGAANTSVRISLKKTTPGTGWVRADVVGLPKMPAGSDWERPELDMRAGVGPSGSGKQAAMPGPFTVKRVTKAPVVDGIASPGEWAGAPMRLEQTGSRDLIATPACTARLVHDGQTLYVSLTVPVKGAASVRRGKEWGRNDGAEICFIDAKGAAATASWVVHGFPDGNSESLPTGGVPAKAAAELGKAVAFAAKVGEKEWTGEWAIPLSAADTSVSPGKRLPFNFCVYRSESDEWILWVGSKGPAYGLENGGTIVLE